MDLLLHLMTGHFDRCTDRLEVFSLSLAMVEVDFWCLLGLEVIKHARWIQLYLSMTYHECGIGISSIFDPVFRYLPIFLTLLLYWVPPPPPMSPSFCLKEVQLNNPADLFARWLSDKSKYKIIN